MLAQAERLELEHGQSLRLLSALEVLQARREAAGLAQEDKEQALCANACLLAKALERDGAPVFENGGDVLARLTVGEIAALMGCRTTQVSTYLYRGKAKLRTMLGGIYGQECFSD